MLAGNHQFHYLTGKHKMINVTVSKQTANVTVTADVHNNCSQIEHTPVVICASDQVLNFVKLHCILKELFITAKWFLFSCVAVYNTFPQSSGAEMHHHEICSFRVCNVKHAQVALCKIFVTQWSDGIKSLQLNCYCYTASCYVT